MATITYNAGNTDGTNESTSGDDDFVTVDAGADIIELGLQGGSDTLTVNGGSVSKIYAGDGDPLDIVNLNGGTVGLVDLGAWASSVETNTVNMTGGTVTERISGSGGTDTITVSGGTVLNTGAAVQIEAAGGDDIVTIEDAADFSGTVDLAAGNDQFFGGDQAEIVLGGAGNDTIDAGDGDDIINAGTGTDVVTGGLGNDTFIYTAGDGSLTITDFGAGSTDANDGDNSNNDFIDLSAFYSHVSELRADLADDGVLNQSDGTLYTTALGGSITGLSGLAGASAWSVLEQTGVVCFAQGSLIQTANGQKPVEELRIGDMVMTHDHGLKPIRWIGARRLSSADLSANQKLLPIRIRAGALGSDLPERDLVVSPQHRVLVRSKVAQRMFGEAEVLVSAKALLGVDGVAVDTNATSVVYWHFVFDQHEIVYSEGAPTEALYLGKEALKSLCEQSRSEIYALFPDLLDAVNGGAPEGRRRLVPAKQGRNLAMRLQKNRKPILDCKSILSDVD